MFRKFLEDLQLGQQLDQNKMNATERYLGQVQQAGYTLISHQTHHDVAMSIIKGQDFGLGQGVNGTVYYTNPQSLRKMIENMHLSGTQGKDAAGQTGGAIHRNSTAIVVLAVPRSVAGRTVNDLDHTLMDLTADGKIKELKIPNQYIVGYWQADGQFFGNSRFSPQNGALTS